VSEKQKKWKVRALFYNMKSQEELCEDLEEVYYKMAEYNAITEVHTLLVKKYDGSGWYTRDSFRIQNF